MDSTNRMMMWMMPLMSLWIGFTVPAGLSIYWITQYFVSMLQEVICGKMLKKDYEAAREAAAKREADEIRKRAEIEANQMVSDAPVMAQARQKAREILSHADEEAKKTCRETNEYCVDLLRRTEDALAAAHAEMRQVHNQFRSGMGSGGSGDRDRSSGGSRMYDAEADG